MLSNNNRGKFGLGADYDSEYTWKNWQPVLPEPIQPLLKQLYTDYDQNQRLRLMRSHQDKCDTWLKLRK
jgi:hypothetical protein